MHTKGNRRVLEDFLARPVISIFHLGCDMLSVANIAFVMVLSLLSYILRPSGRRLLVECNFRVRLIA